MMFLPSLRAMIETAARAADLPSAIVGGLVMRESNGNPKAFRPEVGWQYFVGPDGHPCSVTGVRGIFPCPDGMEVLGQLTGWGLCQVQGSVAREYGFAGAFLSDLWEPERNLHYGCRHLAKFVKKYGKIELALSAYNAGRPIEGNKISYVQYVLDRAREYSEEA